MLGELLDFELGWGVALGLALMAAVAWPFVSTIPASNPPLFACLCFALMTVARFHRRTTLFEAGLPIPGRQILAARLLVVLALVWFPALAIMGETVVLRGWNDALPLLELALVSTLLVLAVQSLRIRETNPPRFTYALGFAACALSLAPQLLAHWGVVLGISLAGIAALLARFWRSVPEGFQIAPAEAKRTIPFKWRRPSSRRVRLPVWWPAWRSFFKWRDLADLIWIVFPLDLGMYLVVSMWILKPAVAACQRLEWLLVLPITRRRMLLMMLLPWLCILIVILSFTRYFGPARKAPMVSTGYSAAWPGEKATGPGTPNVLVPASFWRWARGGAIPAIESPWGEETQPPTFLRLGLICYNPYSVAPGNSARFLDWQFARATKAVYGRSVPLSQAAELQKPGLTPIPRQLRTHFVALLAATLVFLGMLHLVFWRKTKGDVGWTWIIWLCVFVPFSIDLFTVGQVGESGSLSEVITIQLAAILPQNWPVLIVLAALLVGSLYLAAERQFKKMDLIPALRPARSLE
jgi:hypothetical protein